MPFCVNGTSLWSFSGFCSSFRASLDARVCLFSTVQGVVHITGGGFQENIPRVLPKGLACEVDTASWRIPDLFVWIQRVRAASVLATSHFRASVTQFKTKGANGV